MSADDDRLNLLRFDGGRGPEWPGVVAFWVFAAFVVWIVAGTPGAC